MTPIRTYDFPSSELLRNQLAVFIIGLAARFPDCSRKIMIDGWRSPIGDWLSGSALCPGLADLQAFVKERLPPSFDWDFLTWFEIVEPGGTILPHRHFEHQYVAHYTVEGTGDMVVSIGTKVERVAIESGRIVIVPGLALNSVPDPIEGIRISAVLNANMVV